MTAEISFRLNGRPVTLACEPRDVMADLLSEHLHMRGVRVACDQNVCGACTILCDGEPVASCATFGFAADGRDITTLDGLEPTITAALRDSFAREIGFQCGFCTAGMLTMATALLQNNREPSRPEIVNWMSGNLCRCTGYDFIVTAIEQAAHSLRDEGTTA